jgi:hypothetical protein
MSYFVTVDTDTQVINVFPSMDQVTEHSVETPCDFFRLKDEAIVVNVKELQSLVYLSELLESRFERFTIDEGQSDLS